MSRKNRRKNRTMQNNIRNSSVQMPAFQASAPQQEPQVFLEKDKEGSAASWTEMRQMPIGSLEIDEAYQRGLKLQRVKRIVSEFNPDLVNVVKASFRDGHYYIFDGQHTVGAIREKFKDENYPVLCKIFHGLTLEDEAKLFAEQTGLAQNVPVSYKLRALALSGDGEVTDFLKVTRDNGFLIEPGKKMNRAGAIQAVKMAFNCYRSLGAEQYGRMLSILQRTWHGEQWSVTQNMLSGMCTFMKTYGGCLDSSRFEKKLSGLGEKEISRLAGQFYDLAAPYRYARAFAVTYNKGGAKGTLKLQKLIMAMCGEE